MSHKVKFLSCAHVTPLGCNNPSVTMIPFYSSQMFSFFFFCLPKHLGRHAWCVTLLLNRLLLLNTIHKFLSRKQAVEKLFSFRNCCRKSSKFCWSWTNVTRSMWWIHKTNRHHSFVFWINDDTVQYRSSTNPACDTENNNYLLIYIYIYIYIYIWRRCIA